MVAVAELRRGILAVWRRDFEVWVKGNVEEGWGNGGASSWRPLGL
jgi:hypothetical protein